MLGYYEVYVGIKGSEYVEKIWATSNLNAEEELLNRLFSQGIDIHDIDHCESCTLRYKDYDSYMLKEELNNERIYNELDEKG